MPPKTQDVKDVLLNVNGYNQPEEEMPVETLNEGTRLYPSELEKIYFSLIQLGIDPADKPRMLTPMECRALRVEKETEDIIKNCRSACRGIQLQKAFEIGMVLHVAYALVEKIALSNGRTTHLVTMNGYPRSWLLKALYPTINEELLGAEIENYSNFEDWIRSTGREDQVYKPNLEIFSYIFERWLTYQSFYTEDGKDGRRISAATVTEIWNSATTDDERRNIFMLVKDLFNQETPQDISPSVLLRLMGIHHPSQMPIEPSAQITIKNGGKNTTIQARPDLWIMNVSHLLNAKGEAVRDKNNRPLYKARTTIVDIKSGAQTDESRRYSDISKIVALSYILTFIFSFDKHQIGYSGMSRKVITESMVQKKLLSLARHKDPAELHHIHLPDGVSYNIFPEVFLMGLAKDPSSRNERVSKYHEELLRIYRLMHNLFNFARLNKHQKFWSDTADFNLPRPIVEEAPTAVISPKLFDL